MSQLLRVLVADDEPGMRMGVARALRDFAVHVNDAGEEVRFEVEQAASGEQALERIQAHKPDILLLDHKMTGMTGLEVLDRIIAQELEILTVMITAYATLETAIAATKRGAYDFLAKPFTPDELKSAVRKAAVHVVLTRQARELAREKRQVRFQFISVLAHELKAPLAAIQGYLQILRDGSGGEDPAVIRHMIDRSLVRVEGMRKLILDLLDMTRIESGTRKREIVEMDLRDLARAAMDTVAPDADRQQITVRLHADTPVSVHADRAEMEIVFNNLVSNAVKYNRPGGSVDITLAVEGDLARVRVADTGIGMTAEEAGRLFQDFVRIKNDKTRSILGSGLGLSIVKKLALLYGGDAAVTSQENVGSTFTVTLRQDGGAGAVATAEAGLPVQAKAMPPVLPVHLRRPGPSDMDRANILEWLTQDDPHRLEDLWRQADQARREHVGDQVHLRGLIEISNHCRRQCGYCGLRAGNRSVQRYRMSLDEILDAAGQAAAYGYGTVVLQAGEDEALTGQWVGDLVGRIRQRFDLAITLSLGERPIEDLRAWKQAGADRYLLRFETSNPALFDRIHPPAPTGPRVNRLEMLGWLGNLGYEVGSGVMIGIPGQTYADLAQDILTFERLDLDMIGVGPFIAHPDTPLGADGEKAAGTPLLRQVPADELTTYKVVALARLACPRANIPSTTALATLNLAQGRELGLQRGANVVMPNLTPSCYRALYEIYPAKACLRETAQEFQDGLAGRIATIGRTVGTGRGNARRNTD